MKEEFLHYLWRYKKFDTSKLHTTHNDPLIIVHSGIYHQLAGPDFFNAQLRIGSQQWAGNVEIHLKSSDWYVHRHEQDVAYDSIILHVVWEHDSVVFRKNGTEVPTLVLQPYVDRQTLDSYQSLLMPKTWIYCEKQLSSLSPFVLRNWKERLFIERLERKILPLETLLQQNQNDWEEALFCMLAKNFGLNTNGQLFFDVAKSIPYAVIRKESTELQNIEAVLFGMAGMLDDKKEDRYYIELQSRFEYLTIKYKLTRTVFESVQYFKHRPDNFPTIRLSQLATVLVSQPHLFAKVIAVDSIPDVYALFHVGVSPYWETHYQFDVVSPPKKKMLSKSFIDLLLINTILPLQFAYASRQGNETIEKQISMAEQIAAEQNAVLAKFAFFGVPAENAFDSQAMLQLKREYCEKSRCLECAIGMELLKGEG